MDSNTRFDLITQNAEEVLTLEDLKELIELGIPLKHYIGFEISGKVHLGTGLMTGGKIADFQKAGVNCSCYLATYHAWINNKLGGDLDTIVNASKYFEEALRSGIEIMGGNSDKVKFIDGHTLYHNNDEYWRLVIDVAKHTTISRALRSIPIMGRKEGEDSSPLAFLFYPAMQVADIFIQDINIAHAGMDQRKAHVISRDVAKKITIKPLKHKDKVYKPIAIHHPLLAGLKAPPEWPIPHSRLKEVLSEMKMSKSVSGSAVFIHDSPEEIKKTIKNAFCPEGVIEYNPILNWIEHLILRKGSKTEFKIERPAKFGGDLTFSSFLDLESKFKNKELHPLDLKNAVAEHLIKMLEPVRKRFEQPRIKKLKEEIDELTVSK